MPPPPVNFCAPPVGPLQAFVLIADSDNPTALHKAEMGSCGGCCLLCNVGLFLESNSSGIVQGPRGHPAMYFFSSLIKAWVHLHLAACCVCGFFFGSHESFILHHVLQGSYSSNVGVP